MNLLQDAAVLKLADHLRRKARSNKYEVSDLITVRRGVTYQFVDLVMEGGGTLGIALAGYIYAMDQANIRFLSIGGSSVGAVVAMLLACRGGRMEAKGQDLARIIGGLDMQSIFIDQKGPSGSLSRYLGATNRNRRISRMIMLGILSKGKLQRNLGLNSGDRFVQWLTQKINERNVFTCRDVVSRMEILPEGLRHRHFGFDYERPTPSLKIIAADITTSIKAIFPQMAPLYWSEPDKVNPALLARASMSIPLFFRPFEVEGVSALPGRITKWRLLCDEYSEIPDKITFADGGLFSNFPIGVFHQNRVPNAPTFGAKLSPGLCDQVEKNTLGEYLSGLFSAMQHHSDYDFFRQNPDYQKLITYIPTQEHNWLNFNMTEDEKLDLFRKGMEAAFMFLETFDWAEYKNIRKAKVAHQARLREINTDAPSWYD